MPKEHEETVEISAEELREIIEKGERLANATLTHFRHLKYLLNNSTKKSRPTDEASQK